MFYQMGLIFLKEISNIYENTFGSFNVRKRTIELKRTARIVQSTITSDSPDERRIEMTLYEKMNRDVPEYYPTMYLDGYTPEEILRARRKSMLKKQKEDETVELSERQEKELEQ